VHLYARGRHRNLQAFDGGPELSCDRRDPTYIRLVLTPKSNKEFTNVGDQGCCGAENILTYGKRWVLGPSIRLPVVSPANAPTGVASPSAAAASSNFDPGATRA